MDLNGWQLEDHLHDCHDMREAELAQMDSRDQQLAHAEDHRGVHGQMDHTHTDTQTA